MPIDMLRSKELKDALLSKGGVLNMVLLLQRRLAGNQLLN
jgi:hypothetical protein